MATYDNGRCYYCGRISGTLMIGETAQGETVLVCPDCNAMPPLSPSEVEARCLAEYGGEENREYHGNL